MDYSFVHLFNILRRVGYQTKFVLMVPQPYKYDAVQQLFPNPDKALSGYIANAGNKR
jgi:hypothetical protein